MRHRDLEEVDRSGAADYLHRLSVIAWAFSALIGWFLSGVILTIAFLLW